MEKFTSWVASIVVVVVLGLISKYIFNESLNFISIVTLFYILQGNGKKG